MRTPPIPTLPLALALLATAASSPVQAGPVAETMGPVWAVTDPLAECLHPQTGACTHPCEGAEGCAALAHQAAAFAQAEAGAAAAAAQRAACGDEGCRGAAGQALARVAGAAEDAAASVRAAADGAADQADAAVAAADADGRAEQAGHQARGEALKAYAAAQGAYVAAHSWPAVVDESLPRHLRLRCQDAVPFGPFCAVWLDRAPFRGLEGTA
jgi:hypothetical protein